MNSQRLLGEIAVVTGSDSGIGQASQFAFAKEGVNVAVTYMHDEEGAERTKNETRVTDRRAYLNHLDLRDPAQQKHFQGGAQPAGHANHLGQ